jgi:hypothetical protein
LSDAKSRLRKEYGDLRSAYDSWKSKLGQAQERVRNAVDPGIRGSAEASVREASGRLREIERKLIDVAKRM